MSQIFYVYHLFSEHSSLLFKFFKKSYYSKISYSSQSPLLGKYAAVAICRGKFSSDKEYIYLALKNTYL